MNLKNLLSFTIFILILSACGGSKKEAVTLEEKKALLTELGAQQVAIDNQIKQLEADIAKLEPNREVKVKNVVAIPVTKAAFNHYVDASGRVSAENNVFVSPKMGGAITNVYVKEGDFVSKGQRVAMIDNTVMRSSIMEVELQIETAKTLFEKQKALWDQRIGTEVQFIQAKTQLESLEKRLATLKSQDAMNVVTSPISGYVDEVRLKAGEIAAPGLGILRVVNLSDLKAVANVPDTYAGTIQKGDLVKIKLPDLKKEFDAKLSFVSQTINPTSRTFIVEATLPTNKEIKPNLVAQLLINDQSVKSAISIPENLIQNTEQGKMVFVAVDEAGKKVARAIKVETGLSYDGNIEILSGLKEGDVIITQGSTELVDGDLVSY